MPDRIGARTSSWVNPAVASWTEGEIAIPTEVERRNEINPGSREDNAKFRRRGLTTSFSGFCSTCVVFELCGLVGAEGTSRMGCCILGMKFRSGENVERTIAPFHQDLELPLNGLRLASVFFVLQAKAPSRAACVQKEARRLSETRKGKFSFCELLPFRGKRFHRPYDAASLGRPREVPSRWRAERVRERERALRLGKKEDRRESKDVANARPWLRFRARV